MKRDLNQGRFSFKRETLLNNLAVVVTRISEVDIPVTITAIYAFGGVLRDKERLHDIDIICLYSQDTEQKNRWKKFFENFSTIHFHDRKRSPIYELYNIIEPYREQRIPLSKAIETKEFSDALVEKGIEAKWAACFSWTEIFENPIGFFIPGIEKVLYVQLFRGTRGLSPIFIEHEKFVSGESPYTRMNSVLAWSPEVPDIKSNLFARTDSEKTSLLVKELKKFGNEIKDFKKELQEIKRELNRASAKLTLNYNALAKSHSSFAYSKLMSYEELLEICEKTRNEMRKYQEEIHVLKTILFVTPTTMAPGYPLDNPIEEEVAFLTLIKQPKAEVKEKRIREILSMLGLPENKVETIKMKGYRTEYKLIDAP